MTYLKLHELIQAMSEDQKKMKVTVNIEGAWRDITLLSQVCHSEDAETYPVGQPVLE